jgi:choline kinase/uncharacterized membrane protein YbhN (UPF0104 family)/phosphatidylglycerophosphate synthase
VVPLVEAVPARPRTGVVLAAGRSERLSRRTRGRSKALLRVGGVPLVELAIRRLRDAGIERVVVVVGRDAGRVSWAARRAGGDVQIVRADGWEAGNGASLLAAEAAVRDEEWFMLLCVDHVFDPGSLAELAGSPAAAVLIDPRPDQEVWSEGTKVRVVDGAAVAFGKELLDPAVDCGAFLLPPMIFDALRQTAADGDHSLAAAVGRLACDSYLGTVILSAELHWQDVDTPRDLRTARRLVRRSLIKQSDGPIARYVNRPISTRITAALAPLRVPPTFLSVVTFLLGIWGAWSLSAGRALMGGLLVQAASILDGSDGETARLFDRSSSLGRLIDGTFDRFVDAAVIAGLLLWAWDDPSRAFRITAILASGVGWAIVATALRRPLAMFEVPRREQPILTALLGGRDARMFIIALGAIADRPLIAFWAGIATYGTSAVLRVVSILGRRYRQLLLQQLAPVWPVLVRVVRITTFPVLVVVVLFGVVPRLADLNDVWEVLSSLSAKSALALAALALWNLGTYWPMLVAAMPGLRLGQAALVSQSSTAVAMTVPAGGAIAVGISYAMYASWGFSRTAIARSTLATFFANMSFKLVLPACSLAVLAIVGEPTTGLVVTGVVGVGLVLIAGALVVALLRDERPARRIGRTAERAVSFARGLAGRSPVSMWGDRAARFRSEVLGLLRDRWRPLFVTELVSQFSVFMVMLMSLRLLGISNEEVSWAQAFAVFAFVRLGSSVPIVPGNVGLAELGYIGGLTLAGGDRTEVVAAVLLFRFLTYFIQIPIGGATYLVWRRRRDQELERVTEPSVA